MLTSFSLSSCFFINIIHKTFRLVLKSPFCLCLVCSPCTNSQGGITMKLALAVILTAKTTIKENAFLLWKGQIKKLEHLCAVAY